VDYSVKIGGEAGQGIQTVGGLLAEVAGTAGYHVFAHQDYESRVRGGHNFYQLRISTGRATSSREKVDIVVGLDKASLGLHKPELTERGIFILDAESLKMTGEAEGDPGLVHVPFERLAVEKGGSPIMANVVAVGAVMGMLGMDLSPLLDLLGARFRKKGEQVVRGNIDAARAGYDYAREKCPQCSFAPEKPVGPPKLVIDGVTAVGLGAVASGCKFYAAYPMTPSTGVLNTMAAHAKEYGIVVEQAEDEIAALQLALGASFGGVRAMTGSSGGGFALMAEGLALAGMTETPVVITIGMRPGPATGLPTRTEQGDLLFVMHAGHGEFPRVIFAPGTPEQAVLLTNKAFDLAEKYQIPAFVLFDQYLGDSQWTYEKMNTDTLVYTDYRVRGEEFRKLAQYKRHALTESGVSPLAVPGDAPHVVVTDSDEHDEEGHIIEDGGLRRKMVEKRVFRKWAHIAEEMKGPEPYGSEDPELLLAGWGSSYGVLREAVDALNARGTRAAMLCFTEIFPLPSGDWLDRLKAARRTVCVEMNATAQFSRYITMETGFTFNEIIKRYDGRPFSVGYVLGALDAGH
jgi:2-oxoglutarate ferredoxin oxidoreductase subunit alpha